MSNTSVLKQFSRFVSLNILGMIGFSCYVLADTYFISQAVGPNGLTALNFCLPVFSLMTGCGMMLGIGGATRYSLNKKTEKDGGDNTALFHSTVWGGAASFLFIIAAIFFVTPISRLLGADDTMLPLTEEYMRTVLWFGPLFIFNNILVAFVRNDDDPRLSMVSMLVSSFSNIVLDYVFMFIFGMGIFGAALATGFSPLISLLILLTHFKKKKNHLRITPVKIDFFESRQIAAYGFSAFIGELASAITLITFNLVILRIAGNIGVAAYGIVANIALVATAVFTGMSQGIQPLASEWFGMRDSAKIKRLLIISVISALSLAIIIYLTIFSTSSIIVPAFNNENNQTLSAYAERGIDIYFAGYIFAGLNIIAAAFLSAIAHPKAALFISILRSCVIIIPAVFILSSLLKLDGVYLSFVATEFIVFIFSSIYLLKTFKNIEHIVKNKDM